MKSILPVHARDALLDKLEYDVTGLIDAASLTFDQRVQYSIARSLKQLSNHLEANRNDG